MKMPESLKQALSCFVLGMVMITVLPLATGCMLDAKDKEQVKAIPAFTEVDTEELNIEIINVVSETTFAEIPATQPIETEPLIETDAEVEETVLPQLVTMDDIELIARVIWGEAGAIKNKAEQAAVGWTILNRVDLWEKDIETIVKSPFQFYYEKGGNDTVPVQYVELAADVVIRWEREHAGETNVGRVLPADYLFYVGDGYHNHFSQEWRGTEFWDWSLPSPYDEEMEVA